MAKLEETDKPIRIFYANLLAIGVAVNLDQATRRLIVEGNLDRLSPVYREEIVKRAKLLKELLTPPPPSELAPYFGRLLTLPELKSALTEAEEYGAAIEALPVNGGWLLVTKRGVAVIPTIYALPAENYPWRWALRCDYNAELVAALKDHIHYRQRKWVREKLQWWFMTR